jgi:hypothetical protein
MSKKAKKGDGDAHQDSQPAVTRGASIKGDAYNAAIQKIGNLQAEIRKIQGTADAMKDSMGAVADQVISKPPKWKYAQACLDHIAANASCTQDKVCKLLQNGELPGQFFGVKVRLNQGYLSTYKCKLRDGLTISENRGRPILLDDFEISFIGSLIKHLQIRNKSILYIQVAMLIRALKLIKHGFVSVTELDKSIASNWMGGKRKRMQGAANSSQVNLPEQREDSDNDDAEAEDDDDLSDADTDGGEECSQEAAKQKAFDDLKAILGESISKHLMLPKHYKWPSKVTVQRLCIKYDWAVRKGQMQTAHRFTGAEPNMLDAFFDSTLRAYINFEIVSPSQRHNTDEKRVGAEFQQSGQCVRVMCIKRPSSLDVAGSGRASGCKSTKTRMICGVTMLPFISADNRTLLMIYIRQRLSKSESASKSKELEKEILDAIRSSYADKGIAVACFTTDTGWMNQETFKKCVCLFVRELLKEQNVMIQFSDERAPTFKELPRLNRNHILFLDNASCHDTASGLFQLDCLFRGLILNPTPPNTTNITQPCDQHVNKLFTMWLRQCFTSAIEFDIAQQKAPKFDAFQLTLWEAQITSNNATLNIPQDMVLDLRTDFRGDQAMQAKITRLNSVLEQKVTADKANGKFTSARIARLTVGPWLAALDYAYLSFVTCGLASPSISSSVTLRSGLTSQAQKELDEQLVRYSLYPHRVKNTPIAIAAAEVYANRISNMEHSKAEVCNKAAALLNLAPLLINGLVVETGHNEHELTKSTAALLWGPAASESAIAMASSVLQARELVIAQNKAIYFIFSMICLKSLIPRRRTAAWLPTSQPTRQPL